MIEINDGTLTWTVSQQDRDSSPFREELGSVYVFKLGQQFVGDGRTEIGFVSDRGDVPDYHMIDLQNHLIWKLAEYLDRVF